MYRLRILPVILIMLGALVLFSCKGGKKRFRCFCHHRWKYNDPDNGGFEVTIGAEQVTGPGLVLIEGGRFTMGRVQQDVMFDWNNEPRTVTVSSFYMDETEIRNVDYREYLYWIRRVYKDYPEAFGERCPIPRYGEAQWGSMIPTCSIISVTLHIMIIRLSEFHGPGK